jgi:hypothetical protein
MVVIPFKMIFGKGGGIGSSRLTTESCNPNRFRAGICLKLSAEAAALSTFAPQQDAAITSAPKM